MALSVLLTVRDAYAYVPPDQAFPGLFDDVEQEDPLPIPNLDEASGNDLPIPNLDDVSDNPPIPNLDLFGNETPPIPTLDLFPDGSDSPGSTNGNSTNAGGGNGSGRDPNYILYGSAPVYAPSYGPYDPYTGQPLPGTTLSVRDPRSGAPLSDTGPGMLVAGLLILGSIGFTLRKAARKRSPIDL